MALISLKSLGVTMSAPLFSNLDLTIGAGDRLGIVAANGRGKSTLLKCLAGELEPTSGDITRTRGLRVGHVEQAVADALLDRSFHQVVADALPPEQADSDHQRHKTPEPPRASGNGEPHRQTLPHFPGRHKPAGIGLTAHPDRYI